MATRRKNGGTGTRITCFPIGYIDSSASTVLQQALNGAHSDAINFVANLKAHKGANGNDLLLKLHALDIADKHKYLLIVGAANSGMNTSWQPFAQLSAHVPIPNELRNITHQFTFGAKDTQFPLKDGDEVLRVAAAARGNNALQFSPHVMLAFGDVDEVRGQPLISTIEEMYKSVNQIINDAEARFFK